ncbi:MAG: hypothetical protein HYY51_00480 [Candidatus Magasanikbacteria bacterium]|nr:hypothetical protein [Candidatus Magasanikbacteria bacterium]
MQSLYLFFFALSKILITQIIGVLGVFFAFGFLLSKIQSLTQSLYLRSIGWKGILWTAWIGTPIHEGGHYLLAKLFRHHIESVHLFEPDKESGGLGQVNHSFNPKSGYQRIGNFFIGAAPLIVGSGVLALLLKFLVPNGLEVLTALKVSAFSISNIIQSLNDVISILFNPSNFSSWQFWLFVYLSFCVCSHLAPSSEDQKGMWKGFAWLVLLLALVNGVFLLFKTDITAYILSVNQYLGFFVSIFLYALFISVIHFLAAYVLLYPLSVLRRRRFRNFYF